MSYFKYFDRYEYPIKDQTYTLSNITIRAKIPNEILTNERFVVSYNLSERDTPELLSDRLYQTVEYYWIVLLYNQIYDMENQWPRTQTKLIEYISETYPLNELYDVLYYTDVNGNIVDLDSYRLKESDFSLTDPQIISKYRLSPVSVYDHELELNEQKRKVKIVKPEYVGLFVNALKDATKR